MFVFAAGAVAEGGDFQVVREEVHVVEAGGDVAFHINAQVSLSSFLFVGWGVSPFALRSLIGRPLFSLSHRGPWGVMAWSIINLSLFEDDPLIVVLEEQ